MELNGRALTPQEWRTTIAAPGWRCVYRSNLAMRILMGVSSVFLFVFFAMIWAAVALMAWKVSGQIAHGVREKEFWGQIGGVLLGMVFTWFSVRDVRAQIGDWLTGPSHYAGTIERTFDSFGKSVMLHFVASGPWVWGVSGELKHALTVGTTFVARFHPRTRELLEVYVRSAGSESRSPKGNGS